MAESTPEEIAWLVAKDPAYGNVICRCEMVTEGEIINAIKGLWERVPWMASNAVPARAWDVVSRASALPG